VVEYTGSRADWVSLLSAGAEISGWGMLFLPLNAFTFPKTTRGVFSFKERRIHFAPLNQTSSMNPVPSGKGRYEPFLAWWSHFFNLGDLTLDLYFYRGSGSAELLNKTAFYRHI
jgi:hypothetical protein